MENQNQSQSSGQPAEQPVISPSNLPSIPHKSKTPLFILIAFVVLIFIGGGVYLLGAKNINQQKQVSIAPTIAQKVLNPTPQTLSPIPTQSQEIDASGMKTYKNFKYGFSIKYPSNLQLYIPNPENPSIIVKFLSPEVNLNDPNNMANLKFPEMGIEILTPQFSDSPLGNSSMNGTNYITNWKEVVVDNIKGHFYQTHQCALKCDYDVDLPFENGHKILRIRMTSNGDVNLFNKFYPTFKFTDQSQPTDTSSWKTYTNDIFSFQYPNNWYVNKYEGSPDIAYFVQVSDVQNSLAVIQGASDTHTRIDIANYASPIPLSFPYTNGSSVNKTIKPFSINGLSGIRGQMTSTAGVLDTVNLENPKGGYVFLQLTPPERSDVISEQVFTHILSTFKFTK